MKLKDQFKKLAEILCSSKYYGTVEYAKVKIEKKIDLILAHLKWNIMEPNDNFMKFKAGLKVLFIAKFTIHLKS